ncbi:hypothetical protein ES705_29348 [subsurface metagenome]
MPITLSGREVAEAISLTERAVVFVAKIVSGRQIESSFLNKSFLSWRFSEAASTTKSDSLARFKSEDQFIRDRTDSISSWVIFPFSTLLLKPALTFPLAFSTISSEISTTVTP